MSIVCQFRLLGWVRFGFKSLQSLISNKRQFLQGNLFFLAVCTHEVPLYLCSIFCSCSLVQVSTVSYRVWSMEHASNSRNLNTIKIHCILPCLYSERYAVSLTKNLVLQWLTIIMCNNITVQYYTIKATRYTPNCIVPLSVQWLL